jgi:hypothetical protein
MAIFPSAQSLPQKDMHYRGMAGMERHKFSASVFVEFVFGEKEAFAIEFKLHVGSVNVKQEICLAIATAR